MELSHPRRTGGGPRTGWRSLDTGSSRLVDVGPLLGSVSRQAPGGAVFDIHDYSAWVHDGTLSAGDDAAEARWVTAAEYALLTPRASP
jgi:hypothetical protein